VAFSLVPRSEHFFDDFVGLAKEIRDGARVLKQMLSSEPPDMAKVDAIKDVEHNCDQRTRAIIDRVNRTFVTPLDREDIHALAISLDDVMDAIDAAAAVTRLYKIEKIRPGARRLADLISRSPPASISWNARPTASTRTRSCPCSTRRATRSP
jgi:uncharacterized protein